MDGNPSSCTFGYDIYAKSRAIICDCAPGYVFINLKYLSMFTPNSNIIIGISTIFITGRVSYSLVKVDFIHKSSILIPAYHSIGTLKEILISDIPVKVAQEQTYSLKIPEKFDAGIIATNCGEITLNNNNDFAIYIQPTLSKRNDSTCILSISDTVFNIDLLSKRNWLTPNFLPPNIENPPIIVAVSQVMTPIKMPNVYDLVNIADSLHHINFLTIPELPSGIILTEDYIMGTPTELGTTHFTLFAVDDFGGLKLAISNYTVTVTVVEAPVLSTGLQLFLEIALPILVSVILLFLIYYRVLHRQRRALPFDFSKLVVSSSTELLITHPLIPLELNRDTIKMLDLLGKGSFAKVYKGTITEKGSPGFLVAVKSLLNSSNNTTDREELLTEASLMMQFDHENVVKLIGVVTAGDPLLVVIEYCEGGSLEVLLQQCQFPEPKLQKRFSLDCARGMIYLSSLNYIHRDLAARNVFISSDLTAKIGDFGLTRGHFNSESYISKKATLSIRWSAPEALEEHKFSEQSDVWSFGVVLYEIWSLGKLPYNGMPARKVWSGVIKGMRLNQPPTCPYEIYAIMQSCWSVDGARPKFVQLYDALSAYQVGATTSTTSGFSQSHENGATMPPNSTGLTENSTDAGEQKHKKVTRLSSRSWLQRHETFLTLYETDV